MTKKGIGLMIAVAPRGATKPKEDLSSPGPLDRPETGMGDDEHEAFESPEEEDREERGGDALEGMLSPLIDAGIPSEHARGILADIFRAAADGLSGSSEKPPGEEESGDRYGR